MLILNGLLYIDLNWSIVMRGPVWARIEKLVDLILHLRFKTDVKYNWEAIQNKTFLLSQI